MVTLKRQPVGRLWGAAAWLRPHAPLGAMALSGQHVWGGHVQQRPYCSPAAPRADHSLCFAFSPLAALTTLCYPSWAASTAGPWVRKALPAAPSLLTPGVKLPQYKNVMSLVCTTLYWIIPCYKHVTQHVRNWELCTWFSLNWWNPLD